MNSKPEVEISLNGVSRRVPAENLAELIRHENPSGTPIAAALNGEFIPRSQHAQTELREGDQVDLVAPVGGG